MALAREIHVEVHDIWKPQGNTQHGDIDHKSLDNWTNADSYLLLISWYKKRKSIFVCWKQYIEVFCYLHANAMVAKGSFTFPSPTLPFVLWKLLNPAALHWQSPVLFCFCENVPSSLCLKALPSWPEFIYPSHLSLMQIPARNTVLLLKVNSPMAFRSASLLPLLFPPFHGVQTFVYFSYPYSLPQ